ncbi:MAG: hypothetical protein B6244_02095 [Candidatus Cloacimonetes bacterium 4572_55]|nr:MAG: hypothetical protein B6244_02095 [Candidatus Cloacimonetes bacterium 4572_55]
MNLFAGLSLRNKLIISFLIILAMITVTIVIVNFRSVEIERKILAEREDNIALFEVVLDSKLEHLKGFVKNFALHPELIELVSNAPQDSLVEEKIYHWLRTYLGDSTIHLITVTNSEGWVIANAANIHGNKKKSRSLSLFVTQAIKGDLVSGFERISRRDLQDEGLEYLLYINQNEVINSGIILKATAPITYNRRVIGTISAGYVLNNDTVLVKTCREKINNVLETAIYNQNYKISSSGTILPNYISEIDIVNKHLDESCFVWENAGSDYILSKKYITDIKGKEIGHLVLVEWDPVFDSYQFRRKLLLVLFVIMAILIGSFSLFILDRHFSEPVKEFKKAISGAERGDFSARISCTGEDELGQLGRCFNSMINKIEGMVDQERSRREDLKLLNDSTKIISVIVDLEMLWHQILERVIVVLKVEGCSLYMKDPHTGQLECKTTGSSGAGGIEANLIKAGEHLAKKALKSGESKTERIDRENEKQGRLFDALLSAPLIARGEAIGALNIYNKESGQNFSSDDISLLTTLAGQAAISINNATLYKEVGEQERMKKELEIARSIQKELRPANLPKIENLNLTGTMKNIKETGSNFLDFYPNDDGSRVVIAIGIVFTKGVEAQIIKMMCKTVLQCFADQFHSPKKVLTLVNEILAGNLGEKELMTLFYGVWVSKNSRFTYGNAGHEFPIFYQSIENKCSELKERGRLIGKSEEDFDLHVKDVDLTINKDDKLILFTPGLVNAMNSNGVPFGTPSLIDLIHKNDHLDAPELHKAILDAIKMYQKQVKPTEDMTLLVMQGRQRVR